MSNIKKIYKSEYFPFLVLGILLIPLHYVAMPIYLDDVTYLKQFAEIQAGKYSIFDLAISNYNTWTSRTIIESLTVLIVPFPMLWASLDIGFFLLSAFSLSYLIESKDNYKKNFFIVALLLIYPFSDLGAAGWLACTMGYLWILSSVIYVSTLIKKVFLKRKICWYEYITYILATVYAANNEQANLCLLLILSCAILCGIKKKINLKLVFILLLITGIELLIIMLAPGNEFRFVKSMQEVMPQYEQYNIFQKLYMSYSYTINTFIVEFNPIYFLFTFMLVVLSLQKCEKIIFKVCGIFPCVFSFSCYALPWERFDYFFHYQPYLEDITSRRDWIPFALSLVVVVCILIAIANILKDIEETLYVYFVLGVGLASRLAMGLSPTVYVSHYRTAIYLYFAFIYIAIYLWEKMEESDNKRLFLVSIMGYAIITLIHLIYNIVYNGGVIHRWL